METAAAKEMNTSSFQLKALGFSYPSRVPNRSFFIAHVMFRVLAIAFTVASISVLVTSGQDVLVFGIRTMARYSYSSAFKFLVVADAVVCGFSGLSLILVCLRSRSAAAAQFMNSFYLFLHDMVMMVLLISGCSAATAIGYVSRYGAKEMNWVAVCDYVGKFCNQVLASLVLSYLAFFCYLALTAFSAHKLMTRPTE
ncbi:CASP-like protein 1F2 [Hevea brasiliensis]|uniref:CASP-like protein 1F2 n=1 Tax=Hevea brasiliensis TaxID=3981 RepID=UPI0025F4E26A|nr:CASP-like protein 1F2 [Hevea brasiliensis]